MGKLYCLPLGADGLENFILEYKERGYSYGQALFLLPGGSPAQDMARAGGMLAGDFSFAIDSLLRFSKNIKLKPAAKKLVVAGLLRQLAEQGGLNFFAGFAESSGVADALAALFGELASAGIQPDDLSSAFAALSEEGGLKAKDREILIVYHAYRNFLDSGGFVDAQSVYLDCIDLLRGQKAHIPWQKIYISGFHRLDALQLALIKELSQVCEIDVNLFFQPDSKEIYNAAQKTYEDILGLGFERIIVHETAVKEKSLQEVCDRFFGFGQGKVETGLIKISQYANRRQEMQELVAEVKNKMLSGAKAEDFLLLVRSISLYPGLKREFLLAGVPVDLPESFKLYNQPLSHILTDFLSVVAGDVRAGLSNLFAAPALSGRFEVSGAKVREILAQEFYSTWTQAKLILKRELGGDTPLLEEFTGFISACPREATAQTYGKHLGGLLDWLDLPGQLGSLYKAGQIDITLLKLLLGVQSGMREALEELSGWHELAGEATRKMGAGRYAVLLREKLQELKVDEKGRPGGVKVVEVSLAQGLSYPYVYVFGLKEGEFPRRQAENWLYSDRERSRLAAVGVLPVSRETADEDSFFFASALAAATKELRLSFSLAEDELISSYVDDVVKVLAEPCIAKRQANQVLPTEDMIISCEVLADSLAAQALPGEEVPAWLGGYLGEDFFLRAWSDLPRRSGSYNGYLSQKCADGLLDSVFFRAFSVSRLESYAACPFRFLVEYVWRPRDWQAADEKMRADVKGTLYHECLKRFLQPHLGLPLPQDGLAALAARMDDVFEEALARLTAKGYLKNTYITPLECAQMKDGLQKWLAEELYYQQGSDFTPCRLEWRFGDGERPFSLALENGEVTLTGQVDRIDTDGKSWFVTDYKSKNTPGKRDMEQGLDLQVPVYLLAVEKFFGAPLGGGYFSVEKAQRGGGLWLEGPDLGRPFSGQVLGAQKIPAGQWEEWRGNFYVRIKNMVEAIGRGEFPPQPLNGCPDYCAGLSICRLAGSFGMGGNDE